ncbi:hypothetical protein HMPREF1544_00582 [Mucor circinelloides 1006PhL]|uniref:Uncharacterized protein n=1 Tax=Mucor circinelloides f. circinelloides (strain 1006PhL) TaxID=1220926 RepID=S2JRF2_MUCC1|nr:hypothetical protein HMPREF1544_00582 [Mucor circinelloides 1006PhL]
MQLPTTASKQKRTSQQLVNTASTYGITTTTTTTTTTASLKSYQLPFISEYVVYIILNSSKTSGAISRCFDALCSMSFAMLLFLSGSVLCATSH